VGYVSSRIAPPAPVWCEPRHQHRTRAHYSPRRHLASVCHEIASAWQLGRVPASGNGCPDVSRSRESSAREFGSALPACCKSLAYCGAFYSVGGRYTLIGYRSHMQLVPYLGIDAACLDAHVKTLASSAQEFDLAPIARQSLPGLEVATEPSTRRCSKSSSDNRRYSNMAGMWLDRQGLAASRELAENLKRLGYGKRHGVGKPISVSSLDRHANRLQPHRDCGARKTRRGRATCTARFLICRQWSALPRRRRSAPATR
jgi:hypothetical protein